MNPRLPIHDSQEPQQGVTPSVEQQDPSTPPPTFLVKILNGPHEGAEMEIPEEGLVVGSGDACDLILFDSTVASRHFRLIPYVEGKSVILSPLEGELFLEGLRVEGDAIVESLTQVITAGDIHFITGIADQEWPEKVAFPVKIEVSPDAAAGGSSSLQGEDLLAEKGEPRKKKRKSLFLPVFIWVAVAVAAVGFYFTYTKAKNAGLSKNTPSPSNSTKATSTLVQQIKSLPNFLEQILPEKSAAQQKVAKSSKKSIPESIPLETSVIRELLKRVPGVVFSFNNEGGKRQFEVWTRGDLATTAARRILAQFSPPILYSLVELNQLETSASTLSQLFGIPLQVEIRPEGVAIWKGYQQDEASWRIFAAHASSELPAIRDHHCEVIFGNRLALELNKELEQQGFKDNVRAIADETGLRMEGSFPRSEQLKWDAWIGQVRQKYSSRVAIADRVNSGIVVKRSLKDFFPAPVVGISGSDLPWVSLANGAKFFQGAKLKNGHILEAITSNTLQISGPEGVITFPLPSL